MEAQSVFGPSTGGRRQFELNEQSLPTRAQAPLRGWLHGADFALGGLRSGGLRRSHRSRLPRPFDLKSGARPLCYSSLFWLACFFGHLSAGQLKSGKNRDELHGMLVNRGKNRG